MSIQSGVMICDVCGKRIEWRSGFFVIHGEQYHVLKNIVFSDKAMRCHEVFIEKKKSGEMLDRT